MPTEYDFFKIMHGKTIEEWSRIESAESVVDRQIKELSSNHTLRILGHTQDKTLYISEEERKANFHILGSSNEGKSKFLEYNIREDIKRGNGVCLIDPSDRGDTCKNVLSYCAEKNLKNVIYIAPETLSKYKKVAPIKAFYKKYLKESVDNVIETGNILFDSKSANTPRLKRNLTALLRLLGKNDLALSDAQLFTEYQPKRNFKIFDSNDRDSRIVGDLFNSKAAFEAYFLSSVNRLDVFFQEPLSLMLGSDQGVDFVEAISKGYVVLVNIAPTLDITPEESQLLGVLIIAQIITATDILNEQGWRKKYNLYIDEAGRFGTPQIDTLLSYKRKSGLILTIAHHYLEQFDNRKVKNAVQQNAKIKLMFNTASYKDRLEMMQDFGYGGDITPQMASFANQDLPQRTAIIKKNKEKPVRIRIPDVKPAKGDVESYLKKLFENPLYQSREQIERQIEKRKLKILNDPNRTQGANTKNTQSGTAPNRNSDGKSGIPDGENNFDKWKDVS